MKKAFGTHDIARFCQVSPATVGRWIEDEKIPSFTTGGGHRRVWADALVAFMKDHSMTIPPELTGEKPVLRVLIVDDEPPMRELVRNILERVFPRAEFLEAEDGFEAGQKIAERVPALVILDLRLPGLDGLKVCETVKTDPRLKDIRIVAVTGYDIERSRKSLLAAGADGFIAKPFKVEQLVAEARRLLPAE